MKKKFAGFTIVELLVVVIVIGILATVGIVAYNGVQARSRDSKRIADIDNINKAIQLHITYTGTAPNFGGACSIATGGNENNNCYTYDTTHTSFTPTYTWAQLQTALAPYRSGSLPVDPCGPACQDKRIANNESDGYFVYKYSAPASLMGTYNGKVSKEDSYFIVAQNLESRTASFGYGIGSY